MDSNVTNEYDFSKLQSLKVTHHTYSRAYHYFQEISYYLTRSNQNTIELTRIGIYDNLMKNKHGNPILRYTKYNNYYLILKYKLNLDSIHLFYLEF